MLGPTAQAPTLASQEEAPQLPAMSAKQAKSERRAAQPATVPVDAAPAVGAAAEPAWIDSSDPRRRLWGKIALWVIWAYVAALWLLALDQLLGWGIFGPKAAG